MDLRTQNEWKELFENSYKLKNVKQIVIDYNNMSDNEKGSVFTIGTL